MESRNDLPTLGIATAHTALIVNFPRWRDLLALLSTMSHREFDLVCRFAFNLKATPGKNQMTQTAPQGVPLSAVFFQAQNAVKPAQKCPSPAPFSPVNANPTALSNLERVLA